MGPTYVLVDHLHPDQLSPQEQAADHGCVSPWITAWLPPCGGWLMGQNTGVRVSYSNTFQGLRRRCWIRVARPVAQSLVVAFGSTY